MAHNASTATQEKIEDFAEDLGKMLGKARSKAEGWLGQRQAIVKHLTELRDTASRLLADLGHQAEHVVRRSRKAIRTVAAQDVKTKRGPGRPVSGRKRKRTMSPEARAAISAAQKARWAKLKTGEHKK
jgi:hypothetical protein